MSLGPGAAGLSEFDEEEDQAIEALPNEDETTGGRRRGVPPFWIFVLGILLAALAALGYQAFRSAPSVVEVIKSRDCLTCHAELQEAMRNRTVHAPFVARQCLACHTTHGLDLIRSVTVTERILGIKVSGVTRPGQVRQGETLMSKDAPRPARKSKLTKPIPELCADTCHSDLMNIAKIKRYTMPPFAKKLCLSCHQAHGSNQPSLLKSPVKPLCLSCHPQIAKYYSSADLHPPFKAGDCIACHRGHASNVKPLLKRPPITLCLSCHPSIARLMKLPVKMQPFELGNCPTCHNPHGSPNMKLLRKPLPDLCFDCHKGIAALKKKPVQMRPFRLGMCLGCHKPHASNNYKLLVAPLQKNEVCFVCHEKYKKNYQPIGHNKVINNASVYQPEGGVGSCLNCHAPHGSDYAGLIQKEVISLCLTCHGPRRYFSHPIGFNYQDPWRGGYLRCTSCHNPMGSGIARLKRADRDGLCLSCHQADDPAYIYSKLSGWHYLVPGTTNP